MNRLVILIRVSLRRLLIACVSVGVIAGCSPTYNWREIRSDEGQWIALFPEKPVEVSRTIQLPNQKTPVRFTLRSSRIGETMFAVGWTASGDESVRQALEMAMLNNIQAQAATVQRKTVSIASRSGFEVTAEGLMKTDAAAPAVTAKIWMKSLVRQGPTPQVIEILAVGPATELSEETARQFIDSLKFPD